MALIIAGLAGLAVGVVATVLALRGPSPRRRPPAAAGAGDATTSTGGEIAETLLHLLPSAVVLVDRSGGVLLANAAARRFGVVADDRVAVPELRQLVRAVRQEGGTRECDLTLAPPGEPSRRTVSARGRAQRLDEGAVALVVDDVTEARRVEAVRRDFVANVGHEIKTPVGAMSVLVEAALGARDDPEAVHRFLGRLQHEVNRLSRLVQDLVELSRLQGAEPARPAQTVAIDAVVHEAVDRARPMAEAKDITIVVGGDPGALVAGDEAQLVTALVNLLHNAVAYSSDQTRVAVGVRRGEGTVEVSVTDQGIGIVADDLERIFERFYRVDPARSRGTGGTGLGLAIVKHIVTNHGGETTVWSSPGEGSTFTIRLPALPGGPAGQTRPAPAVAYSSPPAHTATEEA